MASKNLDLRDEEEVEVCAGGKFIFGVSQTGEGPTDLGGKG
jgi:hypothetical protein